MANVSNEKKEKIRGLYNQNPDFEYIKDVTGVSVKTIKNVLGIKEEVEKTEEVSEEEESAEYWKTWAGFWEEKYLTEHAKLVKLEAVQES